MHFYVEVCVNWNANCMHRQSFEPTISDLDFVLQKKRFIPDAVSQLWL